MANQQNQPPVIPAADLALQVPAPPGPLGPLAVAEPARNLVAEREQEANRDRALAAQRRQRFMPRQNLIRREPDPTTSTLIFSTAAAFPQRSLRYPVTSCYYPNAAVLLYLARYMDHIMASTKRWTDNCMGWSPLHTTLYISMLFYFQILRAMESAGMFPPRSEFATLLNQIRTNYRFDNLWIPGPLVQFFNNLACFWPSDNEVYGTVTPTLISICPWSREATRYGLTAPLNDIFPNISALVSRLRNICAVAIRDNMTEELFSTDVNGPSHMASLFGRQLTNDGNDQLISVSPGLNLASPGTLRLWRNAAANLEFNGFPDALDAGADDVTPRWGSFLCLDEITDWFGPLSALMAKYCQFWRGTDSLESCPPNGSAAGAYKCSTSGDTNLFAPPTWTAPQGQHNHNTHGNPNQLGHYNLHTSRNFHVNLRTTIVDIPDSMYYAAATYAYNLMLNDALPNRSGQFWLAVPDVAGHDDVSTLQGVLSSITRDYHCDTRLDSSR